MVKVRLYSHRALHHMIAMTMDLVMRTHQLCRLGEALEQIPFSRLKKWCWNLTVVSLEVHISIGCIKGPLMLVLITS
ncbi:hypothetical protein Gotri_004417 [Gossypium trilobum]|uniref:Uncharacterized protein n=1 Tax=Gossypium trilobum TaxID=34281 RepID=A0A7J9F4R6_9ROSI|nr:hypothetical protein [Gossypium trilobum]